MLLKLPRLAHKAPSKIMLLQCLNWLPLIRIHIAGTLKHSVLLYSEIQVINTPAPPYQYALGHT